VTLSEAQTAPEKPAPTGVLATLRATPAPIRYLLSGVFVNQLGAFVQTFLVLYLTARGQSYTHAGLALTGYSAGAVLGTLLGGELVQRIGPRATIGGAMAASGALVGLIPWLSNPSMFAVLLLVAAATGLATQAYRPAAAVMLSELMPQEYQVMGFSMMRIALNLGAAVSPLIAAGLILVDWNLLFWLDYSVLALSLLPRVRPPVDDPDEPQPAAPTGQRRAAWAQLLRDGRYLMFLGSVLLGSFIYVQSMVTLPLQIRAAHHPASLYSAILTVSSVLVIACELKITSWVKRLRPSAVGAVGTALMALGAAGYGISAHSDPLLIVCAVVFVLGVMVSGPTLFTYPATFPAPVKARYIAAHQATFGLGMALGPTLGVLAWAAFGSGVWALCGVLGIAAALLTHFGMERDRPRTG
jgi:MFS family permease